MLELDIKDSAYAEYLEYLGKHRSEWKELESMTHITISRFFRDGPVWQYILSTVFPNLASLVGTEGPVRAWVMGFSSGEEVQAGLGLGSGLWLGLGLGMGFSSSGGVEVNSRNGK